MRWYDAYGVLASCLEGLRELDRWRRAEVVAGAIDVIASMAPGFFDERVAEFPLHVGRRRWYDDDGPETWMLFHGLEQASPEVRDAVTAYLLTEAVAAA